MMLYHHIYMTILHIGSYIYDVVFCVSSYIHDHTIPRKSSPCISSYIHDHTIILHIGSYIYDVVFCISSYTHDHTFCISSYIHEHTTYRIIYIWCCILCPPLVVAVLRLRVNLDWLIDWYNIKINIYMMLYFVGSYIHDYTTYRIIYIWCCI